MTHDAIVTLTDPRSAAAEAYRTLRTNLEFASVDEPLRSILVTSAAPLDHKSVTVANLAVAMSDGDRPVILVDADLRRPAQHMMFGLNNEAGFTDMFRANEAFDQPALHAVPNTSLKVLPSGPLPNIPGQLLAAKKMAQVIQRLTELTEMVLIDAPPIITVNDASLLASQVDGVLLVVKANTTKREHINAAKDRLEKVNANLIGAVLTNAQADAALQYA